VGGGGRGIQRPFVLRHKIKTFIPLVDIKNHITLTTT
jgi:hypothetical protein